MQVNGVELEAEAVVSLIGCKEAAALLNVSTDTLYRWRKSGLGPRYFDLNGNIRYHIDDLTDFVMVKRFNGREEAPQQVGANG